MVILTHLHCISRKEDVICVFSSSNFQKSQKLLTERTPRRQPTHKFTTFNIYSFDFNGGLCNHRTGICLRQTPNTREGGGGGGSIFWEAQNTCTSRVRSPKSLTAGVQGPDQGPWKLLGFDALSCHLIQNWINHIRSNFEEDACCAASGSVIVYAPPYLKNPGFASEIVVIMSL